MDILNIAQAAEFLHLKKPTLYAMCQRRAVPYYKTGKFVLFDRFELENWLRNKRVKTSAELIQEAERRIK